MKLHKNPLILAALAAVISVGLAPVSVAAASQSQTHLSSARVTFKDTDTCGKAKPGHVSCLAVRRTYFQNGIRQHSLNPLAGTTFGATALRKAYGIGVLGARYKVIAIVDAMHSGTAFADLTAYRKMYGISEMANCGTNGAVLTALPAGKQPCFVQMNQDGVVDQSPKTTDQGWAQEIALDIEMASAICQHCSILLVESKTSSFADLNRAVSTAAAFDGVTAISNSYGGPDVNESRQPAYGQAAAMGIAVVASSGDSGYGVSAPASFASVVGVGGTALYTDSTNSWNVENAWTSGGSGCSNLNPPAAWQDTNVTDCQGKSVVDVAAVADPATGVAVNYDGQWYSFGGTSAAAPIIATLFGMKNNYGPSAGAYLWANHDKLHDVTFGSNGKCTTPSYCKSDIGFDGPTGWGTPDGTGAF